MEKAVKNFLKIVLIFILSSQNLVLNAQNNTEKEELYLLDVIKNLEFDIYRVGICLDSLNNQMISPGNYVKSNITCEQRTILSSFSPIIFLNLMKKDIIIGRKINVLFYDLTRTESTVLMFLTNEIWSETIWKIETDSWKMKLSEIKFYKTIFDC